MYTFMWTDEKCIKITIFCLKRVILYRIDKQRYARRRSATLGTPGTKGSNKSHSQGTKMVHCTLQHSSHAVPYLEI